MKKAKTMTLQGNEYAKVAERVRLFREDNTNGAIETSHTLLPSGEMVLQARATKDITAERSAFATGQAYGKIGGAKAFEKLETIAVGRALANLGYLASGEIASSEEMEEFIEFKDMKRIEQLERITAEVEKIDNLDDLRAYYAKNKGLGKEVADIITSRSNELKNATA